MPDETAGRQRIAKIAARGQLGRSRRFPAARPLCRCVFALPQFFVRHTCVCAATPGRFRNGWGVRGMALEGLISAASFASTSVRFAHPSHACWQGAVSSALVSRSRAMPTGGRLVYRHKPMIYPRVICSWRTPLSLVLSVSHLSTASLNRRALQAPSGEERLRRAGCHRHRPVRPLFRAPSMDPVLPGVRPRGAGPAAR